MTKILLIAYYLAATAAATAIAKPDPKWDPQELCTFYLGHCAGDPGIYAKWCSEAAYACPNLNSIISCQHYVDSCHGVTQQSGWCHDMSKHCGIYNATQPTCADFHKNCPGYDDLPPCIEMAKVCEAIDYNPYGPVCLNYGVQCLSNGDSDWCQTMDEKCGTLPLGTQCAAYASICDSRFPNGWCKTMASKCGLITPGKEKPPPQQGWAKMSLQNWISEEPAPPNWSVFYTIYDHEDVARFSSEAFSDQGNGNTTGTQTWDMSQLDGKGIIHMSEEGQTDRKKANIKFTYEGDLHRQNSFGTAFTSKGSYNLTKNHCENDENWAWDKNSQMWSRTSICYFQLQCGPAPCD